MGRPDDRSVHLRAAYYNEFARFPAVWLRNLVEAGRLPRGCVDQRDIREVQSHEIGGFAQCHQAAAVFIRAFLSAAR